MLLVATLMKLLTLQSYLLKVIKYITMLSTEKQKVTYFCIAKNKKNNVFEVFACNNKHFKMSIFCLFVFEVSKAARMLC